MQADDALVHFENGCICCDLNSELLDQVVSLAKSGHYDNMIIEVTGVAEPEGVVESIAGQATGVREDVRQAARLGMPQFTRTVYPSGMQLRITTCVHIGVPLLAGF